jgi:hypothetical protein
MNTHYCSLTNSVELSVLEIPPLGSFSACYGTRRFITAFTRALHLSLSWVRPIQSTPPHPISKRSTLMLSTHLRLGHPSGFFPSGFPTNNLYAVLFSPNSNYTGRIILITQLLVIHISPASCRSIRLWSKYSPQHLFSNTFGLCSSLNLRSLLSSVTNYSIH